MRSTERPRNDTHVPRAVNYNRPTNKNASTLFVIDETRELT